MRHTRSITIYDALQERNMFAWKWKQNENRGNYITRTAMKLKLRLERQAGHRWLLHVIIDFTVIRWKVRLTVSALQSDINEACAACGESHDEHLYPGASDQSINLNTWHRSRSAVRAKTPEQLKQCARYIPPIRTVEKIVTRHKRMWIICVLDTVMTVTCAICEAVKQLITTLRATDEGLKSSRSTWLHNTNQVRFGYWNQRMVETDGWRLWELKIKIVKINDSLNLSAIVQRF